ncbi:hypothetical protein ACLOJK_014221 [Asimina triloba]
MTTKERHSSTKIFDKKPIVRLFHASNSGDDVLIVGLSIDTDPRSHLLRSQAFCNVKIAHIDRITIASHGFPFAVKQEVEEKIRMGHGRVPFKNGNSENGIDEEASSINLVDAPLPHRRYRSRQAIFFLKIRVVVFSDPKLFTIKRRMRRSESDMEGCHLKMAQWRKWIFSNGGSGASTNGFLLAKLEMVARAPVGESKTNEEAKGEDSFAGIGG